VSQWIFLGYFLGLNWVYLALNAAALWIVTRESAARAVAKLPHYSVGMEPGISVLVPAYNEEPNICASVRSMLQLDYPDYEVVVVHDGGKDRTLEVLITEFNLQPFPEAYNMEVACKPVKGIYRSLVQPRLKVIDKVNGGKADALNAGMNGSRHALVCAVDADSILQPDSLRRLVRPFMEDRRVVAAGGTIRIANGCEIRRGHLVRTGMPDNWIARIQVMEYLRAFLFGRMGWTPTNALLIISGAFGLFRKQTVVAVGGWSHKAIGEDMELVVRMHRQLMAQKQEYRIVFLPDPICWTEAPETLAVLKSQRVRWQRGLLESLFENRQMFFARGTGTVGWLAMPVFLVFEAAGPVIELAGYVFMTLAFAFNGISLFAFAAFMLMTITMGVLLSMSALLLEEMSFRTYPRTRDFFLLMAVMVVENFGYRQLNSWWRMVGTWKWIRGKPNVWGEMTRKGIGT
jgi:cellulose synthase/poly-beta-1,6-N-acetylglucosamine synthase-like glycosyltransferase